MSFACLFSSSSSSGSGSRGSGILGSSGWGFYSYSHSESYVGPNREAYAAGYSTGLNIMVVCAFIPTITFATAISTVFSIILMFTGNAVLKDHHHGHLSRADTASVAAIGAVFSTLLFIAVLAVFSFLFNFLCKFALFQKIAGCFVSGIKRYLLFTHFFVVPFIGALDGAVGGSLLYVFKLSNSANARLQPIAILHATEAGIVGASVLLGGSYAFFTVLILIILLGGGSLAVHEFFSQLKRLTGESPPPAYPGIAEAEV